jgi:hypothetical protein
MVKNEVQLFANEKSPLYWANLTAKEKIIINQGGTSSGKCLGKDTPVLMYDLSVKKVQDVVVGDKLMGPDGTPRTVLSTVRGFGSLYEVRQGKGMSYVVNDSHILCLKHSGKDIYKTIKQKKVYKGRRYFPGIHLKTASEYFSLPKRVARQFNGFKTGVELPKRPVIIDPYYLGLWLGDGLCECAAITNIDTEVRDYLRGVAELNGCRYFIDPHDRNTIRISSNKSNPIVKGLRHYGLIKNKHIPYDYLHNDRHTRLQLLAGLIDSDGTLSRGQYVISGTNEALMRQVALLSRSLGFYTTLRVKNVKMKRKDGSVYRCMAWEVNITCNDYSEIPAKITRKKREFVNKTRDCLQTRIKLTPKGEGEYFGFELDGDKMFLLEDFTVTHNTEAIIRVLFTIAIIRKNYVITVISNTVTKLKEDALRIAKNVAKIPEVKVFIKDYNSTDRTYTFHNDSIIEFKSFENEEQAKGGKRHILYVNEATRIPYMIFYQADLRTKVRTFVDYNPTSNFYIHDKVIGNKIEFPSVKVIRSWHVHNPYLTEEEHARIERIQDPQLFKVYARGLTGVLTGTIYPNWEEVEEFPWTDGVVWYVDWGFSDKETADPVAAGRVAFKPKDVDYDYVADELVYKRGTPASQIAQVFKAAGYKSGQPCYCDHSPEDIREMRLYGIHAFPASKGPGSLISGITFMRSKRIAYTTRSENIREERSRYKFMEIEGIVTNTPIDEWNHHMDGIRYACHTHSLRTGQL